MCALYPIYMIHMAQQALVQHSSTTHQAFIKHEACLTSTDRAISWLVEPATSCKQGIIDSNFS